MPFILRDESSTENPPLATVYGKQITAGRMAYYIKEGGRTKCIIFLGSGEMDGIEKLYYNGELLPQYDSTGTIWQFHAGKLTSQPVFRDVTAIAGDTLTLASNPYNTTTESEVALVAGVDPTTSPYPANVKQHKKLYVVFSSGNNIKLSLTAGGAPLTWTSSQYLLDNLKVYRANAGFFDPEQGRPLFFSTIDYTFSGISYVEVNLPSTMSEIEDEPTKFKIYVRGRRLQNYDANGLLADQNGVAFPDQNNLPAQSKFFSANNALVAMDIIKNSMQLETSRIDWASWVKYREYCNEVIDWESGPTETFANPTWTHNGTQDTGAGAVRKSRNTNVWDSGARTVQDISTTLPINKLQATYRGGHSAVGITRHTNPVTWSDMLHGFHPSTITGKLFVIVNNVIVNMATAPWCNYGDILRLEFHSSQIRWYHNDKLIHTVNSPSYGSGNPLKGSVIFETYNASYSDVKMFPMAGVARPTPRFDAHVVFPNEVPAAAALEHVLGRSPSVHWQDVNGKIKFLVGGNFVDVTLGAEPTTGDRVLSKVLVYDPEFDFTAETSIINVALSANGGVASASSTSTTYLPSGAINGDRRPTGWGTSTGGWSDGTTGVYPDWLEVDFGATRLINRVDVITIPDNYAAAPEPTLADTFTLYGIVDFQVQYWDGAAWQNITSVVGNNKVWRQFTFTPISTQKIRVYVTAALGGNSRIVELEAWQVESPNIPVPCNIVENSFSSYKKPADQKQNFLRMEFRDIEDEFYTKKYTYTDRSSLRDYVNQLIDFGIVQLGVGSQSLADRVSESILRWNTDLDLFVNVKGMADTFVVAKGDIVRFAHPVPGWTVSNAPAFVVTEETFEPDTADERSFTLQIYDPEFYSDTDHGPITPSLASTSQSALTPPPAPVALTLQENGRTLADGTYLPVITGSLEFSDDYSYRQRARIYWEKPGGSFEDTGILLEQPNILTSLMGFELVGAPSGVNRVKAITETLAGIQSEAEIISSITITGSSSQIPAPPTSFRAELGEGFIVWKWELPAVNNFISHYEIRDAVGNVLRIEPGDSWTEALPVGINSLTRTIYSVSNSGVYSTTGASYTFSIYGTLSPPSNYLATFNGNEVTHRWSSNPTKITWTSLVNTTLSGENALIGGAGTSWASGATSVEKISGNAYLECQADINHYAAFGFSEGANVGASWTDISFGVVASVDKYETVRNGVILSTILDRQAGDIFRVAIENAVVKFYVIRGSNTILMYTFADTPTFPLRVDVSLYLSGHTLKGIQLFSSSSSNLEYQIASDLAFTNVLWRGNSNFWSEIPSVMGTYTRYLRVVNTVTGAISSSVSQTLNLLTPVAPASATGVYDGVNIKWTWPPSTSLNVIGYEIYSNVSMTNLIASVVGTQYIQSPTVGQSAYNIYIAAKRINDNGSVALSSSPRQGTLTISNPTTPTGYTVTFDGDKLLHRWNVDVNYKYVILDGSDAVIWSGYGNTYDEIGFSTASRNFTRKLKAVNSINLESTVVTNSFAVLAPVAPQAITFNAASITPFDINVNITAPSGLNRATIQKTIVEVLNNTDSSILYTIVNDGVTETVNVSGRFSTASTRTIKARAMYADRFGNGASLTTAASHTFAALASADIADAAIIASKIADGIVSTAHFASTIRPIEIYSGAVLPTLPNAAYPLGATIYWTIDNKQYQNRNNSNWTNSTGATSFSELTGTIASGQITTGTITDSHIDAASNFSKITKSSMQSPFTGGGDVTWNSTTGLTWTSYFRSLPNALSSDGHFTFSAKTNVPITASWTGLFRRVRIGGTNTEGDATVITPSQASAGYFIVSFGSYNSSATLAPNGYVDYLIAYVNGDAPNKLILADGRILTDGQTIRSGALVPINSVIPEQTNFSIGGGNLLPNSSFENDLIGWGTIGATATSSTTQKFHGAKSLKLVHAVTGADAYSYMDIASMPNTTYTMTAWVYVESITGAPVQNRAILASGTGMTTVQDASLTISHPIGVWTKKKITWTTTGSSVTFRIRLYAVNGTVYWDGIQLEIGDMPTAYAPKPDEILPNTITVTEIADNAVTTPKLIANAVVAGKIAAGAVEADKIAANAVIADKIAANAVTADKINANAVTADKIAADAVVANKIATGAVTAQKLTIGSFTALNIDTAPTDITAWQNFASSLNSPVPAGNVSIQTITDGQSGSTVFRNTSGITGDVSSKPIPYDPNKQYRISCWVRNINSVGNFYFAANRYNSNGVKTAQSYLSGTPVVPSTSWTFMSAVFGAGTGVTFPSTDKYIAVGFLLNYNNTAGQMEIQDIRLEEMVIGTNIANNAIQTGHITADAVTSTQIAAGAITAAKIAAGAITTEKLAVGMQTGNLVPNASFEQGISALGVPEGWIVNASDNFPNGDFATVISPTTGVDGFIASDGKNVLRLKGTQNNYIISKAMPVSPGERYLVRIRAKSNGQTTGLYVRVRYGSSLNANGTVVSAGFTDIELIQNVTTGWAEYGTPRQSTDYYQVPATANYMQLEFYNYTTNNASQLFIDDVVVAKQLGTTYIQDGAITTDLLAANSVRAQNIQVGTFSDNLQLNGRFVDGLSGYYQEDGTSLPATFTHNPTYSTSIPAEWSPLTNIPVLITPATASSAFYGNWIPLDLNDTYYIEIWARASSATTIFGGLSVNGAGASVNGRGRNFANGIALGTTWTKITGVVGKNVVNASNNRKWTDSATYNDNLSNITNSSAFRVYFWVNTAVSVQVAQVSVTKMQTGNLIVNGQITGQHIQANSLTAHEILATGTITSSLIQTGAIGADQIAARSIRADKLSIGVITDNLVINPSFEEFPTSGANINKPEGWNLTEVVSGSPVWQSSSDFRAEGAYSLKITNGSRARIGHLAVPVSEGERYIVRFRAYSASTTGNLEAFIAELNAALPAGKSFIGFTGGSSETTNRTSFSTITNTYNGANEALLATPLSGLNAGWSQKQCEYTVPSGVKYITLNMGMDGGNAPLYLDEVSIQKEVHGVLIENGTITANKIQANTITGDKIAANTIKTTSLVVAGLSDNLLMNPSFEVLDGAGFPESWSIYHGSGAVSYSIPATGGKAVQLPTTLSRGVTSRVVAVTPGTKIAIRYKAWTPTASSISTSALFSANMPSNPYLGSGSEGLTAYTTFTAIHTSLALTTTPTFYEGLITVPAGMYWMSIQAGFASGSTAYVDDFNVKMQMGDAYIESLKASKISADTIGAGLIFADQIRQASYTPYQTGSTHSPENAWNYTTATGVTYSIANSTMTYVGSGAWDNTNMVSTQSWQKIKAGTNGYIEGTILTKNASSLAMIGLSGNLNFGSYANGSKYQAMDYAWHLSSNGNCYVFESSTNVFNAGAYVVGDVFRVSVENGYVRFRKNGLLMYTSPRKPAVGTIRSIVNPDFSGVVGFASVSGTQTITVQSVNLVQEGYGQGWRLNPLAGTSVYDIEPNWDLAFDTGTFESDLNIGRYVQKALSGSTAWNTSVVTTETIAAGDGWFQATMPNTATGRAMIGLTYNTNWASSSQTTYSFGLLFSGANVEIWESGVQVATMAIAENNSLYTVAVEGNIVKYRKNGAVFYESVNTPQYPMRGKISLYDAGAIVDNISFTASSSGAGEFNSGITVRGQRLEDIVRLTTQSIRNDNRYRGNDVTVPSNQVTSINYDTYFVSWEDDRWFANISVAVNDYKTNTTKNMDSLKSVRVRVYDKTGELLTEVETAWIGRGVAFSGFVPRKYADMKQEAVFSFEFENIYGYSQPVWYSEAGWMDKAAGTWTESPINDNISFVSPQWFSPNDLPINCQGIPLTSESVRLTWTNAANYPTGTHQAFYRAFKASGYDETTGNEGWVPFDSAVSTGTKDITGLQSNVRYEFCVRPTSVTYGYSNIAYVRTFAVTPPPPSYNAPTALSGSNATAGQIDLSWTANAGANYTKTEIFYVAGTGTPTASSSQLGTGFTGGVASHTGLGNSATYSYRARNNYNSGANYSDWSNTITVTTKPPTPPATIPTNVIITNIAYYSFVVNWTANGGATTHRVQVAPYSNTGFTGTLTYDSNIADSTGKPRGIEGLSAGTTYRIRVSGDNGVNWSTVVFATTYSGDSGGGGGGCLLDTNYITIIDSQETIREIVVRNLRVGDRVLGSHAGSKGLLPASVIQLIPMTVPRLYTVKTSKGYEVQCSATHRIIENWNDKTGKPTAFLRSGNKVLVYDKINNEIVEDVITEIKVESGIFNIVKVVLDSKDHTYIGQGILAHNAKPIP